MADRYWVGGSGNTNDTAHWSASSGGAGSAGVPTSSDHAIFDSASNATAYTVTVNASFDCDDFQMANPASGVVTLAGTSALNIYGNLTLASGMTRTYTGDITFRATSTGKTITSNSVALASAIIFNGVGGGWTLQDNFDTGLVYPHLITLTAGSLDTNGKTVRGRRFIISGTTTRTLTLGATVLTTGDWDATTTTNLTFNAGTSIIIQNASYFYGGGLTYYEAQPNFVACDLKGANTFTNFTRTAYAGNQGTLTLFDNQIVTGTLTLHGNDAASRIVVKSDTAGVSRSFTVSNDVVAQWADFADIQGIGTGHWTLSGITGGCGNLYGNSGISFTSPVTRFWVHSATASLNFAGSGRWSTSSGGTVGASDPIAQDFAVFDANSFPYTGLTVVQNVSGGNLPRMDWSAATNGPTWYMAFAGNYYGGFTGGGVSSTGGGIWNFLARSDINVTMNGFVPNSGWRQYQVGGWRMDILDNFVLGTNASFTIDEGVLSLNNHDFTAKTFYAYGTTCGLYMGNGTWTLAGSGMPFFAGNLAVFSGASAVVKFTDSTYATTKTIYFPAGYTIGKVEIISSAWGTFTIGWTGGTSGTITTFKNNSNQIYCNFLAGQTFYMSDFIAKGDSSYKCTFTTDTGVGTWYLIIASGTINCDYIDIANSHASGGARFFAGPHSTDSANNTGWVFTAANYAITEAITYEVAYANSKIKDIQYCVWTTAPPIEKDITYIVAVPTLITKSLEYQVEAPISITKSLTYDVVFTPEGITTSLSYMVTVPNEVTQSLEYDIILPNEITKALVYDVTVPFEVAQSLEYQVTAPAEVSLGLEYQVTAPKIVDLGLEYEVQTNSAITPLLTYAVTVPNEVALGLEYQVVTFSELSVDLGYAVVARSEIAPPLEYAVRTIVEQAKDLEYCVTVPNEQTADIAYEVDTQTDLPKLIQYTVSISNTLTHTLTYEVSIPKSLTKSLEYVVSNHQAITKSLTYDIRRHIQPSKLIAYAVKKARAVTKSILYKVKAHEQITKLVKYSVKKKRPTTKSLEYVVNGHTASTKTITYQVKTHTAKTKTLLYTVKLHPTITKSLEYVIIPPKPSVRLTLTYAVKAKHAITKSITYALRFWPYCEDDIVLPTPKRNIFAPKTTPFAKRNDVFSAMDSVYSKVQDMFTKMNSPFSKKRNIYTDKVSPFAKKPEIYTAKPQKFSRFPNNPNC